MEQMKPYLKALASAVVCAAAYLVGVLSADDSLSDVTTVQWLGLVVFMGGSFGVTFATPYRTTRRPANEAGSIDVVLLLLVAIALGVALILFGVRF